MYLMHIPWPSPSQILDKMEGVESYDVSLEEKKVVVRGNITETAVLEKVSKTGKATSLWQ